MRHCILSYVADTPRSTALYTRLLGTEPIEASPNFAMFALEGGLVLGLWARNDVEPRATLPGGNEIGFEATSDDEVHQRYRDWEALGLRIIQQPTHMDFGFTFTAADPDGHRLRVFHPPDIPSQPS